MLTATIFAYSRAHVRRCRKNAPRGRQALHSHHGVPDTGLVREMTRAAFMGTGILADAFAAAFTLPNFLRRLFAEGSMTAAFIPTFTGYLSEKDDEKAREFLSATFTILVVLVLAVVALGIAFAPWLVLIFKSDRSETALLTQIMFPFLGSGFGGGLLPGHSQLDRRFHALGDGAHSLQCLLDRRSLSGRQRVRQPGTSDGRRHRHRRLRPGALSAPGGASRGLAFRLHQSPPRPSQSGHEARPRARRPHHTRHGGLSDQLSRQLRPRHRRRHRGPLEHPVFASPSGAGPGRLRRVAEHRALARSRGSRERRRLGFVFRLSGQRVCAP